MEDAAIAPPPMLTSRQHKLVVMQNGTAVDTYSLPLREHILGIEPLYLTLTTSTIVPSMVPMQPPMVGNTATQPNPPQPPPQPTPTPFIVHPRKLSNPY